MGPKRTRGKRMSKEKSELAERALLAISMKKISVRKASKEYGLSYGFLRRRFTGEVSLDSINGPAPVFNQEEEEEMANWLAEMTQREMTIRPQEFLDFVQDKVKREEKKTPFKDGRPGFGWYVAFKTRNAHIISAAKEQSETVTPIEVCRSKLTKDDTDNWYIKFRDFLFAKQLINKPEHIWNADEIGFNMANNNAKLVGPNKNNEDLNPQSSAGKQRITVLHCGSAAGKLMPPFFIYPQPQPKGYSPLIGATEGSSIAYCKNGWVDTDTFSKFIDHFDKHCGTLRPQLLLVDSLSSHLEQSVYEKAKSKGIEVYRILPNTTHLMQPLDRAIFGPLKPKWKIVAEKFTEDYIGKNIDKVVFAQKLKEAVLLFHKQKTVVDAFKSCGIYPVDSTVVTSDMVKPTLTFNPTGPDSDLEVDYEGVQEVKSEVAVDSKPEETDSELEEEDSDIYSETDVPDENVEEEQEETAEFMTKCENMMTT